MVPPTTDQTGRQVVRIFNVGNHHQHHHHHHNSTTTRTKASFRDCDKLTLWVRVHGPEIFAGSTTAVGAESGEEECHWEFAMDVQIPGNYQVEVKVLVWDNVPTVGQCEYEILDEQHKKTLREENMLVFATNGTYPNAISLNDYEPVGFLGFKLYDARTACCTICTRFRPWCVYWLSPALNLDHPALFRNGCELVFQKHTPAKYLLQSHLIPLHHRKFKNGSVVTFVNGTDGMGRHQYPGLNSTNPNFQSYFGIPHKKSVAYFVGCGWSPWAVDFACLDGNDDHIYMTSTNFSLVPPPSSSETETDSESLPLCELDDETVFLENEVPGTVPMPKGRWVREPWRDDDDACGPFQWDDDFSDLFQLTKFNATQPHCWHRDNFVEVGEHCIEMNCKWIQPSSRWRSKVHVEDRWMGVWRNYHCDYLEFTDGQLRECLVQRQIHSIRVDGMSIAKFLDQYIQARLQPFNLTELGTNRSDAISVVLSTLGSFHRAKAPTDADLEAALKKRPSADERNIYYWYVFFAVIAMLWVAASGI